MSEEPIYAEEPITSDDKLWAALSWAPLIGFWVAVVVLLTEEKKERSFIKYHAVLSLTVDVAITLSLIVLVGFCVGPIILLVRFYWAYQAYEGKIVELPILTDFIKNQGWV